MPSLLQRKLMQVKPEDAYENTRTLTTTTDKGHYLSLRPLINPTAEQEEFPFESLFGGLNNTISISNIDETTIKQDFSFGIHSNRVLGLPMQDAAVPTVWKTWESGDIQETGTVHPFGLDKEGVDFVELWQPLNAEAYQSKDDFRVGFTAENARSVTLKIDSKEFYGIVTIVGNIVQGLLHKKENPSISCIRCVVDSETLRFKKYEIKFGESLLQFPSEIPESLVVGSFIHGWEVIEA